MERLQLKRQNQLRRIHRVRAKVNGTAEQPRLAVRISNRQVMAQLVDDTTGRTLATVTSVNSKVTGTMTEKATWVGEQIADTASKLKVKKVALDRGSKLYHGRVSALAEAARKKGLGL